MIFSRIGQDLGPMFRVSDSCTVQVRTVDVCSVYHTVVQSSVEMIRTVDLRFRHLQHHTIDTN